MKDSWNDLPVTQIKRAKMLTNNDLNLPKKKRIPKFKKKEGFKLDGKRQGKRDHYVL